MKGLALVEPDASCLALNVAALCDRGMLTEAVQALKEMRRLPGIDRDLIRRLGAGVDVLC
ncbi:hypothetical protein HK101_001741 [Irineochytrium annulatum]|nr:hypothetical protein HK101_001741 [Irineochytrium annulatum]